MQSLFLFVGIIFQKFVPRACGIFVVPIEDKFVFPIFDAIVGRGHSVHSLEGELKGSLIRVSYVSGDFRERHVCVGQEFFRNENALAGNDIENGLPVRFLENALEIGGGDLYEGGNLRNADFFCVILRNIE